MKTIKFTSINLYHFINYEIKNILPFFIEKIYLSENKYINIIGKNNNILINTNKNTPFIYIDKNNYKKSKIGFNDILSSLLKRKTIISIEQIYLDRIIRINTNTDISVYIILIPGKFNFIIIDSQNKIKNMYSFEKNKKGELIYKINDIFKLPQKKDNKHYIDKKTLNYLMENNIEIENILNRRIFYVYFIKNAFEILPFKYNEDFIFSNKNISPLIIDIIKSQIKKEREYLIEKEVEKLNKKKNKLFQNLNKLHSPEELKKEIKELIEIGDTLKLYIGKKIKKNKINIPSVYNKEKILEIELNNMSVEQYMKNVFKRVNKLKKQQEEYENIIKTIKGEIKKIEQRIEKIKQQGIKIEKNKKQKKKIGREYISPNGYRIICGRNAKENDYITTKIAKKGDIFLHARQMHGSHVIIKSEGKQIPLKDIIYAAQIAAYYSKGKHSSLVEVQYTDIKYVIKRKKSAFGEVQLLREKVLFVKPKIN